MKSLSTMILALICGMGLANAQTPPAEPNFLFIFIDDQAWDATSVRMLPGESFSHTASYRMPNRFIFSCPTTRRMGRTRPWLPLSRNTAAMAQSGRQ